MYWKGDLSGFKRLRAPAGNTPDELHTEDRFLAKLLLREYDEAEKILRDDPHESFSNGNRLGVPKSLLLGELYLARKNTIKAREYFEAARPAIEHLVEQKPMDANNHMLLAGVYAGLGRKEDAIREGQRATEIFPESQSAWFGRGTPDGSRPDLRMGGRTGPSATDPHAFAFRAVGLACAIPAVRARLGFSASDPRFQQMLKQYGAAEARSSKRTLCHRERLPRRVWLQCRPSCTDDKGPLIRSVRIQPDAV